MSGDLPVDGSTTTLKQRGMAYFGESNTQYKTPVRLGRDKIAFVTPHKLWLYEETYGRPSGTALSLTPKMRADLLRALDGGDA